MEEYESLRSLPRACRAGHGRRAERRARRRQHHDAAFGQGAGVRDGVPARLGGRPVPAPARARRGRPLRPGGGAPPRLCRPHPRQAEPASVVRLEPPHPRPVAIDHPVALPRRTAGGACRGRRTPAIPMAATAPALWRRRLRVGPRRRRTLRRLALRQGASRSPTPTPRPAGSAPSKTAPRRRATIGARAPATRSSASAMARPIPATAPAAPPSRAAPSRASWWPNRWPTAPPRSRSATASSTRNSATATSPRSTATSSPSTSTAPARRRCWTGS